MDILAHGLWTNLMYRSLPQTRRNKSQVWWGIVFGILPDLISFTPIFVVYFFELVFRHANVRIWPPKGLDALSNYALHSYNYTHSLVVWTAVLLVAWAFMRKFPWPILGAFLHIFIDLFTHPNFYRTPFLYPLSSYHNPYAISWADPVFMAVNYSVIILVYIFLVPYLRRNFGKPV